MSKELRRALYGKLAGDTTLNALLGTPPTGYSKNIYYEDAPQGAGFPFVLFNEQASTPSHAMKGGANIYDIDVWQIIGVDRSTTADAVDDIASRVKTLLSDASLSISGRTLMWLRPDFGIAFSEVTDGEMYRRAGALYRIVTQPA